MNRFWLTIPFLMILVLGACIEDFEFEGISVREGVVVEGYITNQSYNDLLALSVPTRYFTLKLSNVGDLENVRNRPVLGAKIELHQDDGVVYDYAEMGDGEYGLFYEDFKADIGRGYHLEITLPDGKKVISEIETLEKEMEMGAFSLVEGTKLNYENIRGEVSIVEQEGIDFYVTTLDNELTEPVYYKWDMVITWVYNAALAEDNNPLKYCWASSRYFFKEYQLLEDRDGGIAKELFFLETQGSRFNHGYSVLIRQTVMNSGYYTFWKEVEKQLNQSELFATPPYNIESNLSSDEIDVFGFFGVVNEEFGRWYFDEKEISNYGGWVNDERCAFGPPYPPWCFDCTTLAYEDSPVSSTMPDWWDPIYFRKNP